MSRFSKNFSLTDIFNNQKLAGKIPLINYKDKTLENGKESHTTKTQSVLALVRSTAKIAGKPCYSPYKAVYNGNTVELSGTLIVDHDTAVNAVYNALLGIRQQVLWTANNMDIIRSALKESEKNKRKYGISSQLYLRANSMQEIEGMSKKQIEALMTNIMENIFYGDDFPETQKKWAVESIPVKSPYSYAQRQMIWAQKVGDI